MSSTDQRARARRPEARAVRATPPRRDVEAEAVERWERDIVAASRAAARRTADPAIEAADLAQVARLRVARRARSAKPMPTRYVRRLIANAVKVRRSHPPVEQLDEGLWAREEAASDVLVRDWIAGLPQRLQAVYRLLYVDARTQREAAVALRVSQPRVTQLHGELLQLARRHLCPSAA